MLKLQRFSLGKAKNIKVKSLVDGYFPTLRVLNYLDLGDYSYLNDKLLQKFIDKADRIESLIIPYNSKISDQSIDMIGKRI